MSVLRLKNVVSILGRARTAFNRNQNAYHLPQTGFSFSNWPAAVESQYTNNRTDRSDIGRVKFFSLDFYARDGGFCELAGRTPAKRAYTLQATGARLHDQTHPSLSCSIGLVSGHRYFASEGSGDGIKNIKAEILTPFKTHNLDCGPAMEVDTDSHELMQMFRTMSEIRRMEIAADMIFKKQLGRGFCHLYDGQEAVAIGMEAALTFNDSVITAYRDHGTYIGRGGTPYVSFTAAQEAGLKGVLCTDPFLAGESSAPKHAMGMSACYDQSSSNMLAGMGCWDGMGLLQEVFCELMGRASGAAGGKGGSMHLCKKKNNFYGGWGIVGTSPPLGTGLALGQKIEKKGNVTAAIYGDGSANQGQVYEAFNMAALWKLPIIYVVENNHYGMGTSESRASAQPTFFDRVNYIPGMKVDGMDVFAVKQATLFAREHAVTKGPIVLEMDTYRYHGHSMSDPGNTYRSRSEVQDMRHSRDCISRLKQLIVQESVSSEEELKAIEKEVKEEVESSSKRAQSSPPPEESALWRDVYINDKGITHFGVNRRETAVRMRAVVH